MNYETISNLDMLNTKANKVNTNALAELIQRIYEKSLCDSVGRDFYEIEANFKYNKEQSFNLISRWLKHLNSLNKIKEDIKFHLENVG